MSRLLLGAMFDVSLPLSESNLSLEPCISPLPAFQKPLSSNSFLYYTINFSFYTGSVLLVYKYASICTIFKNDKTLFDPSSLSSYHPTSYLCLIKLWWPPLHPDLLCSPLPSSAKCPLHYRNYSCQSHQGPPCCQSNGFLPTTHTSVLFQTGLFPEFPTNRAYSI